MKPFHKLFIEQVRPRIDFPASKADRYFINECFVNRSNLRLTTKGSDRLKKTDVLGQPMKLQIYTIPELTSKEINFLFRKSKFPFYLDTARFETYDPEIQACLVLMEFNLETFIKRKS